MSRRDASRCTSRRPPLRKGAIPMDRQSCSARQVVADGVARIAHRKSASKRSRLATKPATSQRGVVGRRGAQGRQPQHASRDTGRPSTAHEQVRARYPQGLPRGATSSRSRRRGGHAHPDKGVVEATAFGPMTCRFGPPCPTPARRRRPETTGMIRKMGGRDRKRMAASTVRWSLGELRRVRSPRAQACAMSLASVEG